jgi:transposase
MERLKFVGLDVHAETIAVAVAEQGGEVRALGIIPNREESIRKLVKKLGPVEQLRFCYEAGPTGYVLYWQLTRMGAKCEVVAPTLVPVKVGDRVKTDRRDALKLARNYRAGELTPVWVPDAAQEALRDLVRAREAAKKDELRARHRLNKFLLRHGRRPTDGGEGLDDEVPGVDKTGSTFRTNGPGSCAANYLHDVEHAGARIMRLDGAIEEAVKCVPPKMRAVIEALQALRGIARVASVTIVAELGELSRFARAKQLMGYGGIVTSEHSSGECTRRGGITKTGNAHLRRVVVEAAWTYRHRPAVGTSLRKRQEKVSEEVKEIAWKAQQRLHQRYRKLSAKGKNKGIVVTAVGRELLGFIWAIGIKVEAAQKESLQQAA